MQKRPRLQKVSCKFDVKILKVTHPSITDIVRVIVAVERT